LQDRNLGLVTQAIDRAPRWTLKKLTATYVTLGLGDIARVVGIQSEDEVRALVLSMVRVSPFLVFLPHVRARTDRDGRHLRTDFGLGHCDVLRPAAAVLEG
jgi:hypothetical protein